MGLVNGYYFLDVPVKCWYNEDHGIEFLAHLQKSQKPFSDGYEVYLDVEIQGWLADRHIRYRCFPGSAPHSKAPRYTTATIRFEKLIHALHFKVAWL